jgi:hypothetical protein
MPFQKGHKKMGGRVAGVSPHSKISRDVTNLLDSLGCNPHEGMARLANDETVPLAIRARMLSELGQYVLPKLRAVELSGGLGLKLASGSGATRERILKGLAEETNTGSPSESSGTSS